MKILVLNWVYNWGSTGYILRDIKNELKTRGIEAIAAAGTTMGATNDDAILFSTEKANVLFRRLKQFGRAPFAGNPLANKKVYRLIMDEKPDIVHLHLLHCGTIDLYNLLIWLAKNNIKTVITHHAENYFTASCGYAFDCTKWINAECKGCISPIRATGSRFFASPHNNWKKMQHAITSFDSSNIIHTTVSPWLKQRFEMSSFSKGYLTQVVMNGIDVEVYKRRTLTPRMIELLEGNKYVLYSSANFNPTNRDDIKGGYYIVALAKLMPEIRFVVVSTSSSNTETIPNNIILWGRAKDQYELSSLYSNADVTVLTSKKETFSMICAESLCCGTPVVGFEAGGPETISIPKYSTFVEYANVQQLARVLKEKISENLDRDSISVEARELYSRKAMVDGYVEIYKKLLSK